MSDTPPQEEPYWKQVALTDMTSEQWEGLCDGCAKCCLHKLEDADTGEIFFTNVSCRLLDLGTCICTRYEDRARLVPDCVILTPNNVSELAWMPSTCAYRLISEGKDLYWWHPLISGDPDTVHRAGVSVRGRAITERKAGPIEHHILDKEP